MTLVIIGLLIWSVVHFFKRFAPGARAGMDARFGAGPARGIIAGLLLLSVVLMIVGYRGAETVPVYQPINGIGHLTVLLMFFAIMLTGMGGSKGRMRSWLRHPMLTGIIVWSVAHLLVNGDQVSLVLWGGMILWAIAEMIVINKSVGPWVRPEPGPAKGDIKLFVITALLFVVIAGIHTVLGYNPFLGTYG